MSYSGAKLAEAIRPELAEHAVREMADDVGDFVHERVVEFSPVYEEFGGGGNRWISVNRERGREPGRLKRSWYRLPLVRIRSGADPAWRAEEATDDEVAPWVEEDTRPHIIRPKRAGGWLRFRLRGSGRAVYARMVRHPGTTGQHMLRRALDAAEGSFHVVAAPAAEAWVLRQERAFEEANH